MRPMASEYTQGCPNQIGFARPCFKIILAIVDMRGDASIDWRPRLRSIASTLFVAVLACGRAATRQPPPACPKLPFPGCEAIARDPCPPAPDAGPPPMISTSYRCGTDGK